MAQIQQPIGKAITSSRDLPQLQDPQVWLPAKLQSAAVDNDAIRQGVETAAKLMRIPRPIEFPPYMIGGDPERDNGRARSSRRILEAHDKFSFEDWAKAGFNTQTIVAEGRIPVLVKEWEATFGQGSLSGPPN